jgi:thioredoxin 1
VFRLKCGRVSPPRIHAACTAEPRECNGCAPIARAKFPDDTPGPAKAGAAAPKNRSGEVPVSENVSHVSDAQFEDEVLKSEGPVLVDFWAEWCGPCKMISPLLDDLAASYGGKLKVAKVNIDQNQKTPRDYNVRSIPTLMVFKDGKVQATQIGAVSRTQLTQIIDKAIA